MKTQNKSEKKEEATRAKSASESAHSLGVKSATSLIDRSKEIEVEEDELSDFEKLEERKELIVSIYKRDNLLSKCQQRIKQFDDDVHTLRLFKEQFELIGNLFQHK